jgi:hypothetical protein
MVYTSVQGAQAACVALGGGCSGVVTDGPNCHGCHGCSHCGDCGGCGGEGRRWETRRLSTPQRDGRSTCLVKVLSHPILGPAAAVAAPADAVVNTLASQWEWVGVDGDTHPGAGQPAAKTDGGL